MGGDMHERPSSWRQIFKCKWFGLNHERTSSLGGKGKAQQLWLLSTWVCMWEWWELVFDYMVMMSESTSPRERERALWGGFFWHQRLHDMHGSWSRNFWTNSILSNFHSFISPAFWWERNGVWELNGWKWNFISRCGQKLGFTDLVFVFVFF